MTPLTLKAHFDGQDIKLDEPCDLQPGTPVTVTVFLSNTDVEKAAWTQAASAGLARAYSDDEPEYTLEDVKR